MPGTGTIAGIVLGPDGRPLTDATVLIVKGAGPHPDIAALTGEDGAFRFDDLVPGPYEVLIHTESCGSRTVAFEAVAGRISTETVRF